jgi:multicomponent K+:H+ antiporter subunit D
VLRVAEFLPVALLVGCACSYTVRAEPVMRYTRATAQVLYAPGAT